MAHGGKRPGAGRPQGARNKATIELQEVAREYTPRALRTLVRIMETGTSEAARVSAANVILERGYGKAKQFVDTTVKDRRFVVFAPEPEPDPDEWMRKYAPKHINTN